MPEISLTDFVDFIVKSGTPRLTKVRQLRERTEYDPASDFWKALREGIVSYHRSASANKNQLDSIITIVNDSKRKKRYNAAIEHYKKFIGRKKISWFQPPRTDWLKSGLTVRVNPELGLMWSETRYVIKLYFKDEQLTKRKADVVTALMVDALNAQLQTGDQVAVLDVHSQKLYTGYSENLSPLLIGEASSFVAIWEALENNEK